MADAQKVFDQNAPEAVQRIRLMFQEDEEVVDLSYDSGSDVPVDFVESIDAEQEANSSDEGEAENSQQTIWIKTEPPSNDSNVQQDVVSFLPSLKEDARSATTPLACWELLFDSTMIAQIVDCTNHQIGLVKEKYSRPRDAKSTTAVEIKAFIGLLYMLGVKKLGRTNLSEIWASDTTGEEFARSVMSEQRFKFLSNNLRFDHKEIGEGRETIDKLTALREMFEKLADNSQRYYVIGGCAIIDEKLEAFRGRSSLKIFALSDAQTTYTYNMEIYPAKQPPDGVIPKDVVLRLSVPIQGSGKNITIINRFSSISLADDLLSKGLTMVGTVRKNEQELPPGIANTKNYSDHSSQFFFVDNKTLVAYRPKNYKVVILLTTMHHDTSINQSTMKPNIVTFYDNTRSVVSTIDKHCASYSVSRNTRRWAISVFYYMLHVASINGSIIYCSNPCVEYNTRRKFLKSLAFALVADHVSERNFNKSLNKRLVPVTQVEVPTTTKGRKRCYMCTRNKNRMSNYQCRSCKKFLCLKDHAIQICAPCFNIRSESLQIKQEYKTD